jgi:putative protein-disulfide isomerase
MPESPQAQRAKIIYAFDGYCGWCWGISATVQKLAENFSDRFDFEAVCGGLMVGDRIGPLGAFGDYIERAIPQVEELTGTIFSEAHRKLLKNRNTMQDSRVPAAAFMWILDHADAAKSIWLAEQILSLNFHEGADLSLPDSYSNLFQKYQLDLEPFREAYSSEASYASVEAHFEATRAMGAEAFPTIIYAREGQFFPLCEGFQKYENLAEALDVLHREPPPV